MYIRELFFVLILCLVCDLSFSQTTTPLLPDLIPKGVDLLQCDRVLDDVSFRRVFPALLIPVIRRNACICLKGALAQQKSASSPRQPIEQLTALCVNSAIPVLAADVIPPHTLTSIAASFEPNNNHITPIGVFFDQKTCRPPAYPVPAARVGVTGLSVIALQINQDGQVQQSEIIKSSGSTPEHKLLDATTLVHFKSCRFSQIKAIANAQSKWFEVELQWQLDD